MAFASRNCIAAFAALLIVPTASASHSDIGELHSWNGSIRVGAKGQLTNNASAYTFTLNIEDNTTPALHLGDKVTVTNLGETEFSPITWWQNGRRFEGKSCSGFLFKKCKKKYHNHHNKKRENYRASEIRFGLRPLVGGDGDCRDKLDVGLNEEMTVSFPSRLCVIGEGRFSRPASVSGPGNPTGPVRVFTMIESTGQPVLYLNVTIVREK